jgi:hypothetical protein
LESEYTTEEVGQIKIMKLSELQAHLDALC